MISVSSCTRFSPFLAGAGEQLEVVDDEQVEAALALQAAGARRELGDRDAAGLVDVERDRLHLAGGVGDLVEIVLA